MYKKLILLVTAIAFTFLITVDYVQADDCLNIPTKIYKFNNIKSIDDYDQYKTITFNAAEPVKGITNYTSAATAKKGGVMYWSDTDGSEYEFTNRNIFPIKDEKSCKKVKIIYNIYYDTGIPPSVGTATVTLLSCKINNDTAKDENGPYYNKRTTDEEKARTPSVSFFINQDNELEIFTNGLIETQFKIEFDDKTQHIYSSLLDIDNSQQFSLGGVIRAVVRPNTIKYELKQCESSTGKYDKFNIQAGTGDRDNKLLEDKVMLFYQNYIGIIFKLGNNEKGQQMNSGGFTLSKEEITNTSTCKDYSCPTNWSKKNNVDDEKVSDRNYVSRCCVANSNTCSVQKFSCDAGKYKDPTKSNVGVANAADAANKCCNQCKYEPSSFSTDESQKRCCDYYKANDYEKLKAEGKTVEQFKDDFPECFDGERINYSTNNPTCETDKTKSINYKSYLVNGNNYDWFNNQDGWIYLLKNNYVENTVSMKELLNNTDVYPTNKSTCSLICVDEMKVNLPGGPSLIALPGQHIVWPNNSDKYPLNTESKLICRAMTSNVTESGHKTACEVWALNQMKTISASSYANFDLEYSDNKNNLQLSTKLEGKINTDSNTSDSSLITLSTGRTIKLYSKNKKTSFGLYENENAYSFKNKNFLPATNLTDENLSNINIGYGALPISWNSKSGDEYTISLNYSLQNLQSTNVTGNYTCKFKVDSPGDDEKDRCEDENCDNDVAIYRTISLEDPFPGIDGQGRIHGSNWTDDDVKNVITKRNDISKVENNPMYEITLGPASIKAIREYNDNADRMYGYLDFTLECKDGKECRMKDFLSNQKISSIFNTNTCGWKIHRDKTLNWNGCDSRW